MFDNLSFIKDKKWSPERPSGYMDACDKGRGYAEELLEAVKDGRNPTLFGAVMRSMVESGVYEGVEVGFCQRIGAWCIRGD